MTGVDNQSFALSELGDPDKVTDKWLVEHARQLTQEADERDIHLRLIGSIGFRNLCDETLHQDMLNREIGDIDFVGLKSEKGDIREMFEDIGYTIDKDVLLGTEGSRFVFYDSNHEIDIFLDGISMCHSLDLRDRLTVNPNSVCLNPSDLLLEKAQIVDINEKDLKDILLLFLEYSVTENNEGINQSYILDLLSNRWGFYYTVTQNLNKVIRYAERSPLNSDQVTLIKSRVDNLLDALRTEPKSLRWRFRSKIGTRIKWYEQVGKKHRN
jgi:hypothetical protein